METQRNRAIHLLSHFQSLGCCIHLFLVLFLSLCFYCPQLQPMWTVLFFFRWPPVKEPWVWLLSWSTLQWKCNFSTECLLSSSLSLFALCIASDNVYVLHYITFKQKIRSSCYQENIALYATIDQQVRVTSAFCSLLCVSRCSGTLWGVCF